MIPPVLSRWPRIVSRVPAVMAAADVGPGGRWNWKVATSGGVIVPVTRRLPAGRLWMVANVLLGSVSVATKSARTGAARQSSRAATDRAVAQRTRYLIELPPSDAG